ncbi:aldehyde dehydrogenase [Paenibacillus glycanilyticus]|uniref:aldehyde dehydrogenase n=1 Tax=Paenibacillus glycanilyticus TaxID=126569 RepID=UPI0020424D45|nr:aldehyde dehydrogenase [Paenibacillus glycanilyticus]MCM3627891.1 aldehyde dehydrogenase [Paenibacillus glycanilyticus]
MNGSLLLEKQQVYYRTGATRSLEFRLAQLAKLRQAIVEREDAIMLALREDLNRSEQEAFMLEIGLVLKEISFVRKRLKRWMKPAKVKTALTHAGSKGYIVPEPLGTALIIAPWNYPFQLAAAPLVGAIAAGNTAVLKPSELSPAVSSILSSLIQDTFDPSYIAVMEGGVEVSRELLNLPFDKIFFTGSVNVGKQVMAAAAKHLTPVTLELGGKSPAIVHHDANLKLAARRLAFGKFINAGQTCIAPDYVLVHRSAEGEFVEQMRKAVAKFYGAEPLTHPDYGRIISERHFSRLAGFLRDGEAVIGGRADELALRIEPTVLTVVDWSMPIMQEEIFGPILPVLVYDELQEAIDLINARPKPLALYLFSENPAIQKRVTEAVPFGGGCINDTLMHLATPYLPFGGVGESGTGAYHGEYSFKTFSHMKSVLKQTTKFDFAFRYPSAKGGLSIIRRLMK